MKASELRVKNKVLFLDKVVTVECITNEIVSISGYEHNRFTPVSLNYKGLQPIPIKEEWLLKLGFTVNYNENDKPIYLHKNLPYYGIALWRYWYKELYVVFSQMESNER